VKTPTTAYPKYALSLDQEAFIVRAVVGVFTNNFFSIDLPNSVVSRQLFITGNPRCKRA
jgi:hypothetical protein